MQKVCLLGYTKEELQKFVVDTLQEKQYRNKQILNWIYKKKEVDFTSFTDLPTYVREKLNNVAQLYTMQFYDKQISKQDGTVKYIFKTQDDYEVPTVYIPKLGRNVVCISTQIGCNVGCKFCNSGRVKFIRNLSCAEIVEQVYRIYKELDSIDGILFMGMGEPLFNYDNVVKSIKIFLDTEMFSISKRHITVSTVGIVPNIYKLAQENFRVKLAISLHSYNDEKRKKFVKNLKYSVEEILQAGIYYAKKTKTKLTLEYVLVRNENDTKEDAAGLIKILKKIAKDNYKQLVKINLIPYNPISGCKNFFCPTDEEINSFKQILVKNGFLTFIRKSYGVDIGAACGQLGV